MTEKSTIELLAPRRPAWDAVLTEEALAFVAMLARRFEPVRQELLARREGVQRELDAGALPGFLRDTAELLTLLRRL